MSYSPDPRHPDTGDRFCGFYTASPYGRHLPKGFRSWMSMGEISVWCPQCHWAQSVLMPTEEYHCSCGFSYGASDD